ncbi:MAG: thioredoxin domain-containing protein, partial [Cyanobacteria bacterium J06632_3]
IFKGAIDIKKSLKFVGVLCLLMFITFNAMVGPTQALSLANSSFEDRVLQVLRDRPEVILEAVDSYQQQQYEKKEKAQQSLLKEVAANPKDFIAASPASSDLADKLTLIEFSDFQCPYCARAHQILSDFTEQHSDQVALVYKHYPLDAHPQALAAAKAAWAAQQQNQFWNYHNELFKQQAELGDPLFVSIAQALNLDLEKFNQDRNSADAEAAVASDIQLADKLGIDGTPYFVMGNQVLSGLIETSELEDLLLQAS